MNDTPSVMSALSAPGASDLAMAAPPPATKDIRQAAKDFEALLLAQILKTAREGNGGGWLGGGDDQAGTTMVEVAEEHLAKTLAGGRGLGLASLLLSHLAPGSPNSSTAPPHAATPRHPASPGLPAPPGLPASPRPTHAAEPHLRHLSSSPPGG